MSDDLRLKAKGSAATARIVRLDELAGAHASPEGAGHWGLDALRGRLVELSARGATATLTMAIELVLEAQIAAEPVGWIAPFEATFYPPDVAEAGVDLAALSVVQVGDATTAARAAERLLRSGAFGLVVIDFGGTQLELPTAHQGRLITLAQTHDSAIVCITEKPADAPSLGSLVSLRAEAMRLRDREHGHQVTLRVIKDKRRGPGWSRLLKLRGPAGY
jgi:recombination protein RecA